MPWNPNVLYAAPTGLGDGIAMYACPTEPYQPPYQPKPWPVLPPAPDLDTPTRDILKMLEMLRDIRQADAKRIAELEAEVALLRGQKARSEAGDVTDALRETFDVDPDGAFGD
jgi:hypothetical protein